MIVHNGKKGRAVDSKALSWGSVPSGSEHTKTRTYLPGLIQQPNVPAVWSPSFASQRLDVIWNESEIFNEAMYHWYTSDNDNCLFYLDSGVTGTSTIEQWIIQVSQSIPLQSAFCPSHPSAYCFGPRNTWMMQPNASPFLRGSGLVTDADWLVCALQPPDPENVAGGDQVWFTNFDSPACRETWVDQMIRHIMNLAEMVQSYRKVTHVFLDNFHFTQAWYPPPYDYKNLFFAMSNFRRLLHYYLGAALYPNVGTIFCCLTQDKLDELLAVVDGICLEQLWHSWYTRCKWDAILPLDFNPSIQQARLVTGGNPGERYGILPAIENARHVLNSGKVLISGDEWSARYASQYDQYHPWTYNGLINILPNNAPYAPWLRDLQDRFEAAMNMITRPSQNSQMFNTCDWQRGTGVYQTDESFVLNQTIPSVGQWLSRDWARWPAQFGAPLGDYTVTVVENGANIYNSIDQTFVDCDSMILSRAFEGGTISIDLIADLSTDLEVRKNAVTATLTHNYGLGVYTFTDPPSTTAGSPVTVSWFAPAGHPILDWVGLYPVGASDVPVLISAYTGTSASSGSFNLLLPGDATGQWELRYFSNNATVLRVKSKSFTVS